MNWSESFRSGFLKKTKTNCLLISGIYLFFGSLFSQCTNSDSVEIRERISINEGWKFYKYDSMAMADDLIYDLRPDIQEFRDNIPADSRPTEAIEMEAQAKGLKAWILPNGNDFIADPDKRYIRPEGNPGGDFPFVQANFNDNTWETLNLPHDWAVEGPFYEGYPTPVGGGMGRLPNHGVAWYRKKIDIPASDEGKSMFLDVDGAMSYAMVWINGKLAGGWPYGYNSWRVDLTPYVVPGGENQLAIRLDNPNHSSRWYPGGGIYRNVWLVKTNPVHVGHWGTYITTENVSENEATINLEITLANDSDEDVLIEAVTEIYKLNEQGKRVGDVLAVFDREEVSVQAGAKAKTSGSTKLENPALWGPLPTQNPNRYVAVTQLIHKGKPIDNYETPFGIRTLEFDPEKGILVNGEHIPLKGVNLHHDLGALGAAFNTRAAERQLELLQEMGCNAVRMAHNPPAPEFLELTDRMGFMVIDEVFDCWERKKTPLDFHLIFPEWYEQDLRAMLRRDRNHPSIIMWSYGNEVGEQYTDEEGAVIARRLHNIVKEEDPYRPTTSAMNWAKSDMPFAEVMDLISLNYQGQGIRQDPIFEGVNRIRTEPQFPIFHKNLPDKVMLGSETASAYSSRGIYFFPVTDEISTYVRDGRGGDSESRQVSSYELYAVDFGASADKVFASLDRNPYVAGEFVWTGMDHLGEPTPYYHSRSSYCGIIDMAGFKKDRFYLYQSRWRPELPMVHILPHWNWPDRVGKVTPVHVFTSGNEAELFLNGKSLGKKKKGEFEYRLRWDDVVYEPGELKVVAYKDGEVWAENIKQTTGAPDQLILLADRNEISADGKDLSFIKAQISDKDGLIVPTATNSIEFTIEGPGEIVGTDNGDPTDMVELPSHVRNAFSGLALAIIRSENGATGSIRVTAKSEGIEKASITIESE